MEFEKKKKKKKNVNQVETLGVKKRLLRVPESC